MVPEIPRRSAQLKLRPVSLLLLTSSFVQQIHEDSLLPVIEALGSSTDKVATRMIKALRQRCMEATTNISLLSYMRWLEEESWTVLQALGEGNLKHRGGQFFFFEAMKKVANRFIQMLRRDLCHSTPMLRYLPVELLQMIEWGRFWNMLHEDYAQKGRQKVNGRPLQQYKTLDQHISALPYEHLRNRFDNGMEQSKLIHDPACRAMDCRYDIIATLRVRLNLMDREIRRHDREFHDAYLKVCTVVKDEQMSRHPNWPKMFGSVQLWEPPVFFPARYQLDHHEHLHHVTSLTIQEEADGLTNEADVLDYRRKIFNDLNEPKAAIDQGPPTPFGVPTSAFTFAA